MEFLKSMVSESEGVISSNRIVVLCLTLAGIYAAIIQKDIAISSMLFGFAFGNKQLGKALEIKAEKGDKHENAN
mgnify:CR=1 FL=1